MNKTIAKIIITVFDFELVHVGADL